MIVLANIKTRQVFKEAFLGVKTPLQIAMVSQEVSQSVSQLPVTSLKLSAFGNRYLKVVSDDNR